jgi:hypothetical protein
MIKLTLQGYWQPEDDMDAVISRWIEEENAKIPADIRENLRELFPSVGEEIPNWAFDGGGCLIVPVETQDPVSGLASRRQPYVLDNAGTLDIS